MSVFQENEDSSFDSSSGKEEVKNEAGIQGLFKIRESGPCRLTMPTSGKREPKATHRLQQLGLGVGRMPLSEMRKSELGIGEAERGKSRYWFEAG